MNIQYHPFLYDTKITKTFKSWQQFTKLSIFYHLNFLASISVQNVRNIHNSHIDLRPEYPYDMQIPTKSKHATDYTTDIYSDKFGRNRKTHGHQEPEPPERNFQNITAIRVSEFYFLYFYALNFCPKLFENKFKKKKRSPENSLVKFFYRFIHNLEHGHVCWRFAQSNSRRVSLVIDSTAPSELCYS